MLSQIKKLKVPPISSYYVPGISEAMICENEVSRTHGSQIHFNQNNVWKKEKKKKFSTYFGENERYMATSDLLNLQKFHLYGEATFKKKNFKLKKKKDEIQHSLERK